MRRRRKRSLQEEIEDTKEFFRLFRYLAFHKIRKGRLYRVLGPTIYQEEHTLYGTIVDDDPDDEHAPLKPGCICMVVDCEDISESNNVGLRGLAWAVLSAPFKPKGTVKTIGNVPARKYRITLLSDEKVVKLEIDAGSFFEHVIAVK